MEQYAGLDVSLEATSVCVVDGAGRVVREAKVPSDPEALVAWFAGQAVAMVRIGLESRLLAQARRDAQARLLMTAPGVGALTALTFAAAIDDPARFRSSRMVGAHFGLTPTKYQSGETDVTGRISKVGDHGVRVALYEAANVILTRPVKGSALKSWALAIARRAGMKKAKVALARKLAVVLHRMLRTGEAFALDGRPVVAAAT